jgi:DNA-binding transcriptional MerR regulator
MRIGELSRLSGVAIPTIKFYLREGLLPPGAPTAANQADYDAAHLARLRLIRALIDVGGVPVAAARAVIDALASPGTSPHDLLGAAHHAVTPARVPDRSGAPWKAARERAARLVADRGWRVEPTATALDQLADALAAIGSVRAGELIDGIDVYADTAQRLAAFEVARVVARPDPTSRMELVVVGTVLGGSLFAALRLLAHEHESAVALDAR